MDSEHGHMHNPIEIDDVESLDSDRDSKLIHNDVESLDSDGDSKLIDNNDDDTEDNDFDLDESTSKEQQQNYTILNEKDISRLQDEDITRISNVLTLSKVSATILLQHYNWIVSKVHDAWFADEEKVRAEVGLLKVPVLEIPNNVKKLDCGICFESYPRHKVHAAACGHPFCRSCWTSYISVSIMDGSGCLTLQCPEPSCRAAVGQDMINMLACDEDKHKYSHYLLRSYIENNRKIKWCPAPGCDYAVDFVVGSENNYDVSCDCKYEFCWNCSEEAHRPVDCETVAKWIFKNKDESENTNWILANSKPCPKCRRPIEKNHGCMHMTCRPPCNFHFCWLCLGPINHSGGACNRFLDLKDENQRREMAKKSIERYTHYYERWAANHSSREKAVADLKLMQSSHIEKLRVNQCQIMSQLKFITEAWVQIIECRRVLKWTYAYGFYLPEHEVTKKQFFEYLQGEAETGLERLHHCAEKELQGYLNLNVPSESFNEFRSKLCGLTRVTRNYFENLVHALENGLSEVKSQKGACSKSEKGTMSRAGGPLRVEQVGRERGGPLRVEQIRRGRAAMSSSSGPWPVEVGRGTMSSSSGPWPVEERVDEQVEEDSDWYCEHCTYANNNNTTFDCQMCNLPRYF